MRLRDLLIDEWISVPMAAENLTEALHALLGLAVSSGALPEGPARKVARDLASGAQGELIRVNDDIVMVVGRLEALDDVSVTLGVSPEPFSISRTGGAGEGAGTARALLLLLTPRRVESLKEQFVPALVRVLRDPKGARHVLEVGSPMEVRGLDELMETQLHERLLVEDALTPLSYRIYPDTPLTEVVDLMIRRQLRAVPVVGESLEVLGIISVGDALQHLLPGKRKMEQTEGDAPDLRGFEARDVMTRTVMCVSEDQSLLEAANLMVNRDVAQLPVVREGELIGFLTRDAILRRLFSS